MSEENDAVATPEEEVVEEEQETTEEAPEVEATEETEEVDWQARALKAEKAIEKAKKKTKTQPVTKTPETDDIPDWGKQILESDKKRSFGYEHNLAPETVDKLYQYAGGELTAEVLEDPAAKGIVKAMESARKNAANTPKGGSTPTYKGKTYAETVTDKDASKDDKQAAFRAAQKAHGIS